MLKKTLIATALLLTGFMPITPQCVYERDHRLDIYEVRDPAAQRLSDSTLAMIEHKKLLNRDGKIFIDPYEAKNDLNLCPGERFREQPSVAECSASLISENMVLTAGHCISKRECGKYAFVFNYKMTSANSIASEFAPDDVFYCKDVIHNRNSGQLDFAIVLLDRPVHGHLPVTLANRNAEVGDSVFTLGYPSGLPMKYAGPAPVSRQNRHYFTARLDSFTGNSGSPVFSENRQELVGILVRGEKDYIYDRHSRCYRIFVCKQGGRCGDEEVTNVESIQDEMPAGLN